MTLEVLTEQGPVIVHADPNTRRVDWASDWVALVDHALTASDMRIVHLMDGYNTSYVEILSDES